MPQDHEWPESHSEQTDTLPAVQAGPESEQDGVRHAKHAASDVPAGEAAQATQATQDMPAGRPDTGNGGRHAADTARHAPEPKSEPRGGETTQRELPATETTQVVPTVGAKRQEGPDSTRHVPVRPEAAGAAETSRHAPGDETTQRELPRTESTSYLPPVADTPRRQVFPASQQPTTPQHQRPQSPQATHATQATQHFHARPPASQPAGSEYPTQFIPAMSPTGDAGPHGDGGEGAGGGWREKLRSGQYRKPGLVAAAVFGFLLLVYVVDVMVTSGEVPRGTTIAGIAVGGMTHSEAEQALRAELEPRMTQPVQYTAGEVKAEFDPQKAGLDLNWQGTIENAGDQPLNPITRLTSFFTTTEVGLVTKAEPNQLENAMTALQNEVNQKPVEGNIVFEGATPVPVEPKHGQELKLAAAEKVIRSQWASGATLKLPVRATPVHITEQAVQTALEKYAKPAVSAPVVVHGEGKDGTLEPEEIAAGLSFVPKGDALEPKLNQKKIVQGVAPELKSTETKGRDAEIVFEGGSPTVKPSKDGNVIKWGTTLKPLPGVLQQTDNRELKAHYEKQPAKLTTEQAKALGIKEVIGEFTTSGFASDSGVNIRVVAEEVDGAIVKPGETFSLNGYTGPRTKAQGYVEAGIIEDGVPGTAVGGGISQFATTLYNAAYFAGMQDAGHQEHSYYISRYPMAREATVFQNPDGSSVIDLKFTNDSNTGVAIQTIWTPSDITVRLWGTKRYDVQSVTGKKTNFVQPETRHVSKKNCSPSEGAPGFTVTDTRILRDVNTGQVVDKQVQTATYNPQFKIVCRKPGT